MATKEGVNNNRTLHLTKNEFTVFKKTRMEALILLFAAGQFLDKSFVESLVSSDVSLKDNCRQVIRKHLLDLNPREHLFNRISKLGLPVFTK